MAFPFTTNTRIPMIPLEVWRVSLGLLPARSLVARIGEHRAVISPWALRIARWPRT